MLRSRLHRVALVKHIPMAKSVMVAMLGPALWQVAVSAQAQAFQPGEWESTSKVASIEMKRAPAGLIEALKQPTTARFCMTPAQAAHGFHDALKEDKRCPLQNVTISGGTFDASQTCHDLAGTRITHWHGSYSPTGYTVNATAKRIGACH